MPAKVLLVPLPAVIVYVLPAPIATLCVPVEVVIVLYPAILSYELVNVIVSDKSIVIVSLDVIE
jgi:hypothetical protein